MKKHIIGLAASIFPVALIFGWYAISQEAPKGKIAFTSDRDGNPEIYVMDADGSNPTNLTKDVEAILSEDIYPSWQPLDRAAVNSTGKQNVAWGWLKQER